MRGTWAVTETDSASKLNAIETLQYNIALGVLGTYTSPGVMLYLVIYGFWSSIISSRPALAKKAFSTSLKVRMEPSAPPPANEPAAARAGE